LIEIGLTLRERRVTLHSCNGCDTRWWDEDGEQIPVTQLLDLARR
jgi:hypothetical protein